MGYHSIRKRIVIPMGGGVLFYREKCRYAIGILSWFPKEGIRYARKEPEKA